jgi:hypothetical protein
MADVIFSKSALDSFKLLGPERSGRIVVLLERISVRPGKYLRPLISDPAYRLRTEEAFVYVDMATDHLVILRIAERPFTGV